MTVRLGTLPIGTRFCCCSLTGELVALSGGSATVKLDSASLKRFTANDGDHERAVEFLAGTSRQTWSLGTEVEVLP